jgi:hypothetical protein
MYQFLDEMDMWSVVERNSKGTGSLKNIIQSKLMRIIKIKIKIKIKVKVMFFSIRTMSTLLVI